ncbi:hypothetical protein MBRA_01517 [Methylobacterium brachiatum]|nr:hypothetical protein MBRA_01517 [Methylobacterium brachiatum]
MNLKAGQTPIADRIAAGMAAAGGDRFFAPGAAYRGEGFDAAGWIEDVNSVLPAGYEVRQRPPLRGVPRETFWLWHTFDVGTRHRVDIDIDPRHMTAMAVRAICKMHVSALEHGSILERERLGIRPYSRSDLPEEAAAPAMGR